MKKISLLGILILPLAFIKAVYLVIKEQKWKDTKDGKLTAIAKMKTKENVTIRIREKKNGKWLKFFKHNALGEYLVKNGYDLKWAFLGSWHNELSISNLIVNGYLADVSGNMSGATTPADYEFIGMGTGTTAATATDTTLETEINNDGNPSFTNRDGVGTVTQETTTVTNDTSRVVNTFTIGAFTPAVTEAGLFNSNTAGTMAGRTVFSAKSLSVGNEIQFTYDVINS